MKIYAHRGARTYAPENTLAAFSQAIQLQADGIELDVHMTLDGEIVVCHDYNIARTSNGTGLIMNQRLAELKQYDFGSWFAPQYKHEKIPTLQEALALIGNSNLSLNIEIKHCPRPYSGIEQKIADLLIHHQMCERVIVSSFHHPTLCKLKSICRRVKTGALLEGRPLDPVRCAKDAGADYLHLCWIFLDKDVMRAAKAGGIGVNVYTVNTWEEYAFFQHLPVDGIISDRPDRFKGQRQPLPPPLWQQEKLNSLQTN